MIRLMATGESVDMWSRHTDEMAVPIRLRRCNEALQSLNAICLQKHNYIDAVCRC